MESGRYRSPEELGGETPGDVCAIFCFPRLPHWWRREGGPEYSSLLRGERGRDDARRGDREEYPRSPRGKNGFFRTRWGPGLLHTLGGGGGRRRRPKPQFRYDPAGYALNFDGGDEARGWRSFLIKANPCTAGALLPED